MSSHASVMTGSREWALWAFPFRPFFLATGAYAILTLVGWLGILIPGWPLAGDHPPMQWHSHEMLFGVVAAAIAGFLLTAMCNWTGAEPLSGRRLQGLFALWLAGRVAMWLSGTLPHAVVALVDLAFLAAVAACAAYVIIRAGNMRNLPLVAVITLLWLANGLFHAGLATGDAALLRGAELGTMGLIVMLMVLIGGRITPAFTRNWLLRNGRDPGVVRTRPWLEATTVAATALLIVLLLVGVPSMVLAVAAAVAGTANLLRVAGWSGWQTRQEPLLWILHLGYAWIPLGLLLLAASEAFGQIAPTAWLHALGPGAMGVLIIGVMSRVALGHTGRPLALPRGAVASYVLILVAALSRLVTALGWLPWQFGIVLSSAAWIGAFAVFLWLYAPILVRPRADGQPG
ncbi:NnrS family protein [Wenzhouxiangella sp. XN201]|uniref:NnrS family protein n=1 Tax=Wenzhouxiangella sp. XN201 TaxID=2710755 RepID=UPI001F0996C0|nr:NnrS family protein [Wenzhouxiangella sp. XN201]